MIDSFAAVAARSADKKTAGKGGYVGFFGISKYEKAFEDAAFALTEDGTYTKPVQSLAGWHIIKRISRKTCLLVGVVCLVVQTEVDIVFQKNDEIRRHWIIAIKRDEKPEKL